MGKTLDEEQKMAGAAVRNYDRVDYATGIASVRAMLGGAIADWAKKYITKDHEREDYRGHVIAAADRLMHADG